MNLLMNTQAYFEGVWGGARVNLFGIHTVCAYIVLFHHFMARHSLLGCGPSRKKQAHIATP